MVELPFAMVSPLSYNVVSRVSVHFDITSGLMKMLIFATKANGPLLNYLSVVRKRCGGNLRVPVQ